MFGFAYKNIDFAHKLDVHSLPLSDFTKHMHNHYELLYFVRGNLDYAIESETKRLTPGEIILIPPGVLHFGKVDPQAAYERYVLKFTASVLPDYIKSRIETQPVFLGNVKGAAPMFAELDGLYESYNDDERYILMTAKLMHILIHLCKADSEEYERQISRNDIIGEVITYINEHIKEPLTMADICNDLHFSKSYLSSEFSKEMKTPMMTYIKYKKIFAAHKQISEGKGQLSAIASEYGFTEYSTFYRNYKKIIGHPPYEFKK